MWEKALSSFACIAILPPHSSYMWPHYHMEYFYFLLLSMCLRLSVLARVPVSMCRFLRPCVLACVCFRVFVYVCVFELSSERAYVCVCACVSDVCVGASVWCLYVCVRVYLCRCVCV